jgi:MoaA/NifB/PqqE/SkfB family radical SAM enzyme|tara:strand:- start:786 stop:1862 length:1077 start_codon:yes stop_codon:yes gene_type:complete
MTDKKQKIHIEGHKLMYHVDEVSRWLKGEIVAPPYVEIGLINSCNHNCVFCALDYLKNKGSAIDKDVLIDNLKDMAEFGVKSVMFAGEGEPLMYPYISEAVKKAKEFGLDIAITTNGSQLSEEKTKSILKYLSWIKFSIDAGTKEKHAKIHGCSEEDFPKLISNIKFACNYRKENHINCKIGCQMLLLRENINEVESLIRIVKEAGVDYIVLKPYSQHPDSINKQWINLNEYDTHLINLSKKYSTDAFQVIYRDITFKEIEKEGIEYEICYGINFITIIDALGNVVPCNLFHEKKEFYYGNINQNSFSDIWKGKGRNEILKKLYKKGCSGCRKGCRMNFVNKYLYSLKNKNIEHINFI